MLVSDLVKFVLKPKLLKTDATYVLFRVFDSSRIHLYLELIL